MGFPILKLPSVARREVLVALTPIELYVFGKTSKRAARTVLESNSKKFSIIVNSTRKLIRINHYFKFEILENYSIEYFNRHKTFNIVEGMRAFYNKHDNLEILFEKGLPMTDFIIDVFMMFRCTVKRVQYEMDALRLPYLLKHIQDNQNVPIEILEIHGRLENRELKWILENIKISGRLVARAMVEPGFEVDFVSECDVLEFRADWVTDKMLQSFKSSAVIMINKYLDSQLTANSLNYVINGWCTGMYPKLEYLKIENIWIFNNVGVRGIPTHAMLGRKREVKKKRFNERTVGKCFCGVQLHAENGNVAILQWTSKLNNTSEDLVRKDFGIFEFFLFHIDEIPQELEV